MNEDQLLQAILDSVAEPGENEPGTITTKEAALAWGVGYDLAMRRLRELSAAGRMQTDKVWRVDDWGSVHRVKGWRVCAEPLAGA